jgi:uncharacterized protein (DUF1501 family)
MSTNRRQFLARSSALTGAAMAGAFGRFGIESASAQAADYKALVCLFQFGGADSNNMVVPDTDYAQYGLVRTAGSQVGIPQANLLTFTASRQGGKSYGFHPSLQPLKDLYDQKKLAIVANAGTLIAPITMTEYKAGINRPPNLFSHSDQQMLWQGLLPGEIVRTGWGGRLADKLASMNAGQKIPTMVSVSGTQVFNSGHDTRPFVIPGNGGVLLSGQGADAVSTARYNALRSLLGTGGGNAIFDGAASILDKSLSAADAANPYLTATLPATIQTAFTVGGTLLNTGPRQPVEAGRAADRGARRARRQAPGLHGQHRRLGHALEHPDQPGQPVRPDGAGHARVLRLHGRRGHLDQRHDVHDVGLQPHVHRQPDDRDRPRVRRQLPRDGRGGEGRRHVRHVSAAVPEGRRRHGQQRGVAADDLGRPDRQHPRDLVRHVGGRHRLHVPDLANWSAGVRNVGFI